MAHETSLTDAPPHALAAMCDVAEYTAKSKRVKLSKEASVTELRAIVERNVRTREAAEEGEEEKEE